jgi:DNA-binding NarL/FixJ family response regulator
MRFVLYADQKDSDIALVRGAFGRHGLSKYLATVADGDEVIAYLSGDGQYADRKAFPLPALIILETKLGRRTSSDVLKWIRCQRELRKIPVVIFTSWEMPSEIQQAYCFGANSYVLKAVDPTEFEQQIRRIIDFWLRLNVTEGNVPAGLQSLPPNQDKNQMN